MKIRLMGAEFFHSNGQTDRHEEANSRFSQFSESVKNETLLSYVFDIK